MFILQLMLQTLQNDKVLKLLQTCLGNRIHLLSRLCSNAQLHDILNLALKNVDDIVNMGRNKAFLKR